MTINGCITRVIIRRVNVAGAFHKPNPITDISSKQGAPLGMIP